MATRWAYLGLIFCAVARATFIPEPMPAMTRTSGAVRSLLVKSNWVFIGVSETNGASGAVRGVVYARPRPGKDKPAQAIWSLNSSPEFGRSLAFSEGVLIVKEDARTHFFHEENGAWVSDGGLDGVNHNEAVGPLGVAGDYLISGMEVYKLSSREFVQSLNPTDNTNHTFVATALTASPARLAITFSEGKGVWVYDFLYNATNWTERFHVSAPAEASARFGEGLAIAAGDVLIGDPGDSSGGANAGAVYTYRDSPAGWHVYQMLRPALRMAGDEFGARIVANTWQVFVAAPGRAEDRQQSGALFLYEFATYPRIAYSRAEKERITLKGSADFSRLGDSIAMFGGNNGERATVVAASGGALTPGQRVFAFHEAVELHAELYLGSKQLGLYTQPGVDWTGTLESTTDLNTPWQKTSSDSYVSIAEWPAGFFRMRSSAF